MALFSVIITSYNQANFIRAAVESAIAQTHGRREVIVVDDASTDGSAKLLEEYGSAIQLIKLDENVGACRARNEGIAMAKGDFLVFLDGDDLLFPWALKVYSEIVKRKQPNIILGAMQWFEGESPKIGEESRPGQIEMVDYETLVKKDRPYRASASAMVIRREAFSSVRGWPTEIFPLEDLDVLFRLLRSGRTVQILQPVTVCYRIHSSNTIHQVATCAGALRQIMEKEKRGEYPHGQINRGENYAFLGGPALFWVKRAYQGGLYSEALRIVAAGWPMIGAAIVRQMAISVKGRQAAQTIVL